jgi:hypothetical protein
VTLLGGHSSWPATASEPGQLKFRFRALAGTLKPELKVPGPLCAWEAGSRTRSLLTQCVSQGFFVNGCLPVAGCAGF